MSHFLTSYVGAGSHQAQDSVGKACTGGLRRRIEEHNNILSLGLEAITYSYSLKHGLVPSESQGSIPAESRREHLLVLNCHVQFSQDKKRFEAQHLETATKREALAFRVLTHAFDIAPGNQNGTQCDVFLAVLEGLDILFTRSLQAAETGFQSPECFGIQGSFSKTCVTPTNRALPWCQCKSRIWTATHGRIIQQVRLQILQHFDSVPIGLPYHVITSRFQAEGLACPHRSKIRHEWYACFPGDRRQPVRQGPDMTLNVVDFICEKGPAYATTHFSEFSSRYGKGPGCHSDLNYREMATRLALILYDALVEPISWKVRTWNKKVYEKVVRRAREHWGGATLAIIEHLKRDFERSPSPKARSRRAIVDGITRKQEAFWGNVISDCHRLDKDASSWALNCFLESYHARNPIRTRQDAMRFFEAFPELRPDRDDAPAALLAFLNDFGNLNPVDEAETEDNTAMGFADQLCKILEPGSISLFDETLDVTADRNGDGDHGGEGCSEFDDDVGPDTHTAPEDQTNFSPCGPDREDFPGYSLVVPNAKGRLELKLRLKKQRYMLLVYGVYGREESQMSRINHKEQSDFCMKWTDSENRLLWKFLTNEDERIAHGFLSACTGPSSLDGRHPGLAKTRTWWMVPTDATPCNYPGLSRFTWPQVADHAPVMGFRLQMNGRKCGIFPLPTLEEIDIMEGLCTGASQNYTPEDKPTRTDLCNYPGLTRFTWGQVQLIAYVACRIIIQLFHPSGDVVLGPNHNRQWSQPQLEALDRLRTNDFEKLAGCKGAKGELQCDYPGLDAFLWKTVFWKLRKERQARPGRSRFPKWTPGRLAALKRLTTHDSDKRIGWSSAKRSQLQCDYPGLEAFKWRKVREKALQLKREMGGISGSSK